MNPRLLSRAEVLVFAKNAATALANGRVPGLSSAEAAEIAAKLNASTDKLGTSDQKVVATRAAFHQAAEEAAVDEAGVIDILSGLKFRMRGARSGPDEYLAVGFDAPAERGKRIDPNRPENLSVKGEPNGVNILKFKGNNTPGSVIFTIEGRTSRDSDFAIVGSTRKQSYKHTPVTPGQFYEYRVRAEGSGGRLSDWSNEAVVYPQG